MNIKSLLKFIDGLEENNVKLVVKEHNMNVVFPDYKSYRIGTTLCQLISTKNKKAYKKKCKKLMKEAIDSTHQDYVDFLSEFNKQYKKEMKNKEKFQRQEDDED